MELFGGFGKMLYLCIKDAKHEQGSDLRKRKKHNPKSFMLMKWKWSTVKKVLQILGTIITTIAGTIAVQSCIG